MNAEEIRRALFPHEETIKRLQTENQELKAQVQLLTQELENEQSRANDDGHGADSTSTKASETAKRLRKKEDPSS